MVLLPLNFKVNCVKIPNSPTSKHNNMSVSNCKNSSYGDKMGAHDVVSLVDDLFRKAVESSAVRSPCTLGIGHRTAAPGLVPH